MAPQRGVCNRLTSVSAGSRVRIAGVDGGQRAQSRLIGMGLLAGACIDVKRNDGWSPLVLAMGHSRIALGRGMAEQVRVCPVHAEYRA